MNWKTFFILFSMLCLLCPAGGVLAQTQRGADIDGEAPLDESGWSVAMSAAGSRVAIGTPLNDGNGLNAGHVRVYEWSIPAWVQLGADIDGEAIEDWSGNSVAMSADGNRVAIGAKWNDGINGAISGHVRVYAWSGTAWVQLGADIDGEARMDYSGYSVALSADGNRVAIGAPHADGSVLYTGHVRVYEWSGTAWVQLGADIDGEGRDQSGRSVSMSADGNRVAIGAVWDINSGTSAGLVRVYGWSGAAWVQLGADIDGEAPGDESGQSVAMSAAGDRVAIGARLNDGNGTSSGHVRVYAWAGTAWVQLGPDIDGESPGDESGQSVAMSADGKWVAIGTPLNDDYRINAGHVRVYTWSGAAWAQVGADIDGVAQSEWFGSSVAMSADGNWVASGARYNSNDNGSHSGCVRVFTPITTDFDQDGIPDDTDNCPDDPNPLETCLGGEDCLGPTNSCDMGSGFCTEQNDNEGDGLGDICDGDDDNDGTIDFQDNCPLDANSFQEDSDFDGLGDVCDASFDGNTASDHVEDVVVLAVDSITIANPPGGNGMIFKLTGKGGVTLRVANAVGAFDAGMIGLSMYLTELQAALHKLDSFDNQIAAKINNGQIIEPEASQLLDASVEIRETINNLITYAGS